MYDDELIVKRESEINDGSALHHVLEFEYEDTIVEVDEETLAHYDLSVDDINFLAHYGVKGMKWGVINEEEPVGKSSSSGISDKIKSITSKVKNLVSDISSKLPMSKKKKAQKEFQRQQEIFNEKWQTNNEEAQQETKQNQEESEAETNQAKVIAEEEAKAKEEAKEKDLAEKVAAEKEYENAVKIHQENTQAQAIAEAEVKAKEEAEAEATRQRQAESKAKAINKVTDDAEEAKTQQLKEQEAEKEAKLETYSNNLRNRIAARESVTTPTEAERDDDTLEKMLNYKHINAVDPNKAEDDLSKVTTEYKRDKYLADADNLKNRVDNNVKEINDSDFVQKESTLNYLYQDSSMKNYFTSSTSRGTATISAEKAYNVTDKNEQQKILNSLKKSIENVNHDIDYLTKPSYENANISDEQKKLIYNDLKRQTITEMQLEAIYDNLSDYYKKQNAAKALVSSSNSTLMNSEDFDDYLAHWGILGMKWGVRRFQNPDGTLTDEGKARYGIDAEDKNNRKLVDRIAAEEDKRELEVVNNSSKLFNQAASIVPNKKGSIQNKYRTTYKKEKYSDIGTEELRKRINTLQTEDQYANLVGDNKYVKSGEEKARETLQTVGSLIAIGGTVISIANTVRNFKEGRGFAEPEKKN